MPSENKSSLVGVYARFQERTVDFFEILDSLNVTHYTLSENSLKPGMDIDDRYFFNKSSGYISSFRYDSGMMNSPYVLIKINQDFYPFYIFSDTLALMVKDGPPPKYIKMHSLAEKTFNYYYSNNIIGIVEFVSKDHPELLSIKKRILSDALKDNREIYSFKYDFSTLQNYLDSYGHLIEILSVGDSIYKSAFSDSLIIIKAKSREHFNVPFLKK